MTLKRRAAKALFWAAGQLMHIKTYNRTYEWVPTNPDLGHEDNFRYTGRMWSSWDFAFTVLNWSEHLDPYHWDHWALVHDGHGTPCPECGGELCANLTEQP